LSPRYKAGPTVFSLLAMLPFTAAAIYGFITMLQPYTPFIVDSPAARSLVSSGSLFRFVISIGLVSTFIWFFNRFLRSASFLFVFMPIFITVGFYFSSSEIRNHLFQNVFDKAGIFARQYLDDDRSSLVVMGSDPGGL